MSTHIDLATPLAAAVGGRTAEALVTQLSLETVGDLLRHYPRRYVDRGRLTDIAGLEIGEHITVVAVGQQRLETVAENRVAVERQRAVGEAVEGVVAIDDARPAGRGTGRT